MSASTSAATSALASAPASTLSAAATSAAAKSDAKAAAPAPAPKRVLIALANGSEDIESVCLIDVLRRAGAHVTVASVEASLTVVAARHTKITADALVGDVVGPKARAAGVAPFDGVFLPGGMPGAERLRDCALLVDALKEQKSAGRWYGAICASPAVVLATHGLLGGGVVGTAYPAFQSKLSAAGVLAPASAAGGAAVTERVVVSHNCVTSVGPGTSIEFALRIVELLYGAAHAKSVADPLIAYLPPAKL